VVEEVRDHLERADAAILTEYRGLKVADLATLRRALRETGAEYKIYKNTLVRRATSDTRHAVLDSLLLGPTAIAFVDKDVAAAAKVLRDFARTHPALVVKGSFVGSDLLDARTTAALADLPPRDVLLAQIAGALAAPMRQFAGLLKALPQNLAYGLSALIDKRVAGGEALPEVGVAAGAEAVGSDAEAVGSDAEAVGSDAGATSGGETSAGSDAGADDGSTLAEAVEAEPATESEAEAVAEAEPEAVAEAEVVGEPEADAGGGATDASAGAEASASEAAVSPPEPAEAAEPADADAAAPEADPGTE
jgi:large subunit ribosomal protein L10